MISFSCDYSKAQFIRISKDKRIKVPQLKRAFPAGSKFILVFLKPNSRVRLDEIEIYFVSEQLPDVTHAIPVTGDCQFQDNPVKLSDQINGTANQATMKFIGVRG